MKELIVIVGSIFLGCLIFQYIVGEDMSLKTASGEQMTRLLRIYGEEGL